MMYEKDVENTVDRITHKNFRSSSYIALSYTPNKYFEIDNVIFYQPLINYWKDYRFLNQIRMRFKTGKNLSFKTSWNYLNDSHPFAGIPSVNYNFSTGIDYDF